MSEGFFQQVAQQAGSTGLGSLIGGMVTFLGAMNIFAKKSDVEMSVQNIQLRNRAELSVYKSEASEKYITRDLLREMLKPIEENVAYIRNRIDSLTKF